MSESLQASASTGPGAPISPDDLVQAVRKNLIEAQLTILELNDTILNKETEKSDAIALLQQLQAAVDERDRRAGAIQQQHSEQLHQLHQAFAREKTAFEQISQDLVQKLDRANREIGATHELAARYASELAGCRAQLTATGEQLRLFSDQLDATQTRLNVTQEHLTAARAQAAASDSELNRMKSSLSWRATSPFRRLRRLLA